MKIVNDLWQNKIELTIPFYDVDSLEVVWHGHYIKYFEEARAALLRKLDYDYPQMRDSGYAWPVIEVHCRYVKPATYGMLISIDANIVEYENRFKINYVIRNAKTNEKLSKGYSTQVAVHIEKQEMCFVSPAIFLEKLGVET